MKPKEEKLLFTISVCLNILCLPACISARLSFFVASTLQLWRQERRRRFKLSFSMVLRST